MENVTKHSFRIRSTRTTFAKVFKNQLILPEICRFTMNFPHTHTLTYRWEIVFFRHTVWFFSSRIIALFVFQFRWNPLCKILNIEIEFAESFSYGSLLFCSVINSELWTYRVELLLKTNAFCLTGMCFMKI